MAAGSARTDVGDTARRVSLRGEKQQPHRGSRLRHRESTLPCVLQGMTRLLRVGGGEWHLRSAHRSILVEPGTPSRQPRGQPEARPAVGPAGAESAKVHHWRTVKKKATRPPLD